MQCQLSQEQIERFRKFLDTVEVANESGRDYTIESAIVSNSMWCTKSDDPLFHMRCQYRVRYEPREFWENVYPNSSLIYSRHNSHNSRKKADSQASDNRIGCIHWVEDMDEPPVEPVEGGKDATTEAGPAGGVG